MVRDGWRDRLEGLGGHRREVVTWGAGVAVLLAVVILWSLVARREAEVAPPAQSPVSSTAPAAAQLYVHVAGAVVKPGLYTFPQGTRAADAIEAAGGPTKRADLDAINLAEVLTDAMKLEVPVRGAGPSATGPTAATPGLVDLNSADQTALEAIPGIGPVTAMAILQRRQEIGSFTAIEDLLDVSGIGPATLESIRPYVTV